MVKKVKIEKFLLINYFFWHCGHLSDLYQAWFQTLQALSPESTAWEPLLRDVKSKLFGMTKILPDLTPFYPPVSFAATAPPLPLPPASWDMEFPKCSLSFFLWFYTCWSFTDPYPQPPAGQINYYSSFKTQSKWLFFEVPLLTSLGPYLLKVLLLTDDMTYYITCCLWIYLATGQGAPSGHGRGSCHPFFLESSGT